MLYRKLKRTWSHNDANYIPRFKEVFPELKNVSSEEMRNRFIDLGLDFYTENKTNVSLLIRLTFPFAVVLLILMVIGLPIMFITIGKWGYPFSNKSIIFNWFRALKFI